MIQEPPPSPPRTALPSSPHSISSPRAGTQGGRQKGILTALTNPSPMSFCLPRRDRGTEMPPASRQHPRGPAGGAGKGAGGAGAGTQEPAETQGTAFLRLCSGVWASLWTALQMFAVQGWTCRGRRTPSVPQDSWTQGCEGSTEKTGLTSLFSPHPTQVSCKHQGHLQTPQQESCL